MGFDYDWNQIFRQLYTQIIWQSEKLNKLERQLDQVLKELQTIQKQKSVNVEKIEYNFDQLKVEKLDGTLNIGITPENVKSIEQFAVGNQPIWDGAFPVSEGMQGTYSTIKGHVSDYLNKDIMQDLKGLEGKYNTPLADEYRAHIVADIGKQVDDRISTYMKKFAIEDMDINDDEDDDDKDNVYTEQVTNIVEQVKNDIRTGIESYLQTFPKKEMK